MPDEKLLMQCFNRGCGNKYDPDNNKEDSCRHHPGLPVFHDAYKGWSCCNKKCIDFTEFLNISGCTLSKHSNIKPPEPEKPVAKDIPEEKEIVVRSPIVKSMERPPFETPLITMEPEITPSLLKQRTSKEQTVEAEGANNTDEIVIGMTCKNSGCCVTYQGRITNDTSCIYHPGVPIFHEGMKYWSCCQRKTSDFDVFLNQVGCETGKHVWKKEESDQKTIQCRWDFHQTASHVVVSIYAKQYCIKESVVKLSPVRLCANLLFPQQSNASFSLDMELRGIVNVEASQVSMFGSKVEIKLKKAEPGSWSKLGDPVMPQPAVKKMSAVEKLTPQVEAVDLDDL